MLLEGKYFLYLCCWETLCVVYVGHSFNNGLLARIDRDSATCLETKRNP